MTRFARSKGSKASNERVPEEATSWTDMKKQLEQKIKEEEEVENRQKAEAKRRENYNVFLKEHEDEEFKKSNWADFPEEASSKTPVAEIKVSKISGRGVLLKSKGKITIESPLKDSKQELKKNGKKRGSNKKKTPESDESEDLEDRGSDVDSNEEIEDSTDEENLDGSGDEVSSDEAAEQTDDENEDDKSNDKQSNIEKEKKSKIKIKTKVAKNKNAKDATKTETKEKNKKKPDQKLSEEELKKLKIERRQEKRRRQKENKKKGLSLRKELEQTEEDIKNKGKKPENGDNKKNQNERKEKLKITPKKKFNELTVEEQRRIIKKREKAQKQKEKKQLFKAQQQENPGQNQSQNAGQNQLQNAGQNQQNLGQQRQNNVPLQNNKRKLKTNENGEEPKRRKSENQQTKMIINGKDVEIGYFDGFPIKKEDFDRLQKLRKEMISRGLPRSEINTALKLERRKAEKALTREKKKVCFNCRKSGHVLSECPILGKFESQDTIASGICFKCGSTEHTHFECKVVKRQEFKFAQCFICKEQGHISKQCPDNPKGLYPKGGACKLCGDVTHLKKDCPQYQAEQEASTIKLGKIGSNIESLDF